MYIIILALLCILLYLNVGGVLTTLKGKLGVIRTNTDLRDLSGQYYLLTENVSSLLKKNFAVPPVFIVRGDNKGNLYIQAEWYVDGKKSEISNSFLGGQTSLNFINQNEPSAIHVTRSFNYCNPKMLQCMKFNSRITLDDYQIKLHVRGQVGTIVYVKK